MNTFASDIHALLQRLVSEETPNLSKYDKDLLSHLEVALYNLLVAENGLESVYKVRFEDSGHLLKQQIAGMGPGSVTDLKADFQVLAPRFILNHLNILRLDNVKRYLSDRFNKITLVESGHVVNSMRKDENQRETKKRKMVVKRAMNAWRQSRIIFIILQWPFWKFTLPDLQMLHLR